MIETPNAMEMKRHMNRQEAAADADERAFGLAMAAMNAVGVHVDEVRYYSHRGVVVLYGGGYHVGALMRGAP